MAGGLGLCLRGSGGTRIQPIQVWVGGWASLGVRALAKAGRGGSGRGALVRHPCILLRSSSKSTRRGKVVLWHDDVTKAHRAVNARDASAASGSDQFVDRHGCRLLIAWLALQNISSIRSGRGICPRFGIVRRTTPNFPAHQNNLAAWLYPKGISSSWMKNWMRTSKLSKSDHSFS